MKLNHVGNYEFIASGAKDVPASDSSDLTSSLTRGSTGYFLEVDLEYLVNISIWKAVQC